MFLKKNIKLKKIYEVHVRHLATVVCSSYIMYNHVGW